MEQGEVRCTIVINQQRSDSETARLRDPHHHAVGVDGRGRAVDLLLRAAIWRPASQSRPSHDPVADYLDLRLWLAMGVSERIVDGSEQVSLAAPNRRHRRRPGDSDRDGRGVGMVDSSFASNESVRRQAVALKPRLKRSCGEPNNSQYTNTAAYTGRQD